MDKIRYMVPCSFYFKGMKMVNYKDEPSIKLITIRFTEFSHDFGCMDFNKYQQFTETWTLASAAGNMRYEVIPQRLSKVVPSDGQVTSGNQNEENIQNQQILKVVKQGKTKEKWKKRFNYANTVSYSASVRKTQKSRSHNQNKLRACSPDPPSLT